MAVDQSKVSKKDKILVVEGNIIFGQKITSILNHEGFDATLVKNGIEAQKLIYNILPRLVLMNIILPGNDSYTLLKQKMAEPLLRNIPVFLLSTHGLPINMNRIPQNSVAEFIMQYKEDPINIVSRVKKYLEDVATKSQAGVRTGIAAKVPTESESNRKVILWVEDDRLIAKILGNKLRTSGFELTHVISGDEAFKALESLKPDIIILDIGLPKMNGLDILQKINANPKYRDTPKVILTNIDRQDEKDRARLLGAKAYIVKANTSLDKITEMIHQYCS